MILGIFNLFCAGFLVGSTIYHNEYLDLKMKVIGIGCALLNLGVGINAWFDMGLLG